ncbi:MAG: Crp/Fnr family transcriptional regulator [Bacteroidota bacterium]
MKKLLLDLSFPSLEKAARIELEQVGTIQHYKKGDVMVSAGKEIDRVFFILNGFVKVCKDDAPATQFVLFYLHAGHAFGVSLSKEEKPNVSIASFIAAEPTTVLQLTFDEKDRLAKKYDSMYRYILKKAVMHYEFYMNIITSIVFEQLDVRIEYFLSRLSKAKNKSVLKINHQEIADGLHASRESVSRLLKKMEEAGKIRLGRGQIEIINLSV